MYKVGQITAHQMHYGNTWVVFFILTVLLQFLSFVALFIQICFCSNKVKPMYCKEIENYSRRKDWGFLKLFLPHPRFVALSCLDHPFLLFNTSSLLSLSRSLNWNLQPVLKLRNYYPPARTCFLPRSRQISVREFPGWS